MDDGTLQTWDMLTTTFPVLNSLEYNSLVKSFTPVLTFFLSDELHVDESERSLLYGLFLDIIIFSRVAYNWLIKDDRAILNYACSWIDNRIPDFEIT